jgi:hypothetical protein
MDIRCRMYMTYDIVCSYRIRHRMYVRCRMSDVQCRTSSQAGGGSFRWFEGTGSPAHGKGKWAVPFRQQELHFKPCNKPQDSVRNTVFVTVVFSHPKKRLWLRSTGIDSWPAKCTDCLWVCQRASQHQDHGIQYCIRYCMHISYTISYIYLYDIVYDIVYNIVYEIVYDIAYDIIYNMHSTCRFLSRKRWPSMLKRQHSETGSPLIALSRATLSRTLQSGTVDRKLARGSCKQG